MQFDEKRVKRKKEKWEREKVLSNCRLVPADIRERLSRSLSTRALLLPVQSCMRGRRKRKKKKETLTSPFPFPLSPKFTSWKKTQMIKNDFCFLSVRGPFLNQISFHFSCKEGGFAWTDTNILVLIKRYRKTWEKKKGLTGREYRSMG